MRHAIIDKNTNKVVNVIIWDGKSEWSPLADHYVIQHDHIDRDDIYNPEMKELTKFYHVKE